jgi:hypothetical protein
LNEWLDFVARGFVLRLSGERQAAVHATLRERIGPRRHAKGVSATWTIAKGADYDRKEESHHVASYNNIASSPRADDQRTQPHERREADE